MIRLRHENGCFLHPRTNSPLDSLQVMIVDTGELSRSYYDSSGLACWSTGCTRPDDNVPDDKVQARRCLDCTRSIKSGGFNRSAPCKFYQIIKVLLPEDGIVCEVRISASSLFAKETNKLGLYKYIDYLEKNREEVEEILTELYLVEQYNSHRIYFKPVRPLAEEELATARQQIEAASQSPNPFKGNIEEIFMANPSHIIKGVEARYPRLDKPYRFDNKAGKNGKSVPCEPTEDGARYELDFSMTGKQAKELYAVMQDAYTNAKGRDKTWPAKLEMPFKKQEDGSFIGKTSLKAAYSGNATEPPAQFDAKNDRLGSDFMLTTGSTVNIAVEMIPFKMATTGVSLRLRGVQVLKYLPYKPASPFEEADGFVADDAKNMFSAAEEDDDDVFEAEGQITKQPDLFDEDEEEEAEVAEPVKRKKKKEAAPADDEEMADIIDIWGDED